MGAGVNLNVCLFMTADGGRTLVGSNEVVGNGLGIRIVRIVTVNDTRHTHMVAQFQLAVV